MARKWPIRECLLLGCLFSFLKWALKLAQYRLMVAQPKMAVKETHRLARNALLGSSNSPDQQAFDAQSIHAAYGELVTLVGETLPAAGDLS